MKSPEKQLIGIEPTSEKVGRPITLQDIQATITAAGLEPELAVVVKVFIVDGNSLTLTRSQAVSLIMENHPRRAPSTYKSDLFMRAVTRVNSQAAAPLQFVKTTKQGRAGVRSSDAYSVQHRD